MRRIFLFPYGGGGASSFRSYSRRFPEDAGCVVSLEIPGHGTRSDEAFAASATECAARMLAQVDAMGGDYILHGHCMGALLAFEAIKTIEASGGPLPRFMVASGRNAPGHMNGWLRRIGELDDRALFAELQDLGGVPRGLSFAMARHFLTVIRNDQAMFADYSPGETRIGVPILALAGRDDTMTSAAGLEDWRHYTSGMLAIEWLEGQHYFILDQPERIAEHIEAFHQLTADLVPEHEKLT
ncbi:MAG: alpha/beta fold hydrolase [Novosphingobium sp.]